MAFVRNPVVYVPDLTNGRPIVDGKVYILTAGTVPPMHDSAIDPLDLVTVSYYNEANNLVAQPQPLYTSKGGCLYGNYPDAARQFIISPQAYVFAVYNRIGQLEYSAETTASDYVETNSLAAANSTVLVGGVEARTLKRIDGIKNLFVSTDCVFEVSGFYVGSTMGGGRFYYDPLIDKALHNGGTIIAPEAIAAWDGTYTNLSVMHLWSGVGIGCFVRIYEDLRVDDFGAYVNEPLAGAANYYAVKSCVSTAIDVRYKKNITTPTSFTDLWGNSKVVFSAGYYHFSISNPLRPQISVDVPFSVNPKRRGLSFVGAGQEQTILVNDGLSGSDFYFWDNYSDTTLDGSRRRYGYDVVQFYGMSFHGPNPDNSVRTYAVSHPRAAGQKVNGFGIISTGWDKEFSFFETGFCGIDTVLNMGGTSNGDKFVFYRCLFSPIRDAVFTCNNNQSVANEFIACNYLLFGDLFKITGAGGGGSQVRGGSLILYPEFEDTGLPSAVQRERALVNASFTASPSYRGSYWCFNGVTFEFYRPEHKDVIINTTLATGSCRVSFMNQCDWNTVVYWGDAGIVPATTESTAVVISGRVLADVSYDNCLLSKFRTYAITNSATNSSRDQVPYLRITNNNCFWPVTDSVGVDRIVSEKVSVTGGAQLVITNNVHETRNSNHDQRKSYSSNYKNSVGVTRVSLDAEVFTTEIKPIGFAWGADANANKIYIPRYARVVGVNIYRPATSSSSNYDMRLTNGLTGGSKVIYRTWTQPENTTLDINVSILVSDHNGLVAVECTASNLDGSAGFATIRYT